MSDSSKNTTAGLLASTDVKLQTTVPSAIKKRGGTTSNASRASTLRGLQSRTVSLPDPETLPDGWIRIKHPDSGVYYEHKEKRLSTASDMSDSRIRGKITSVADVLRGSQAFQVLLKDGHKVDLVLDVPSRNGTTTVAYYCVSHTEPEIFWLEGVEDKEVDIPCTSNKCTVKVNGSRAHCLEAQYWKHCELFPTTYTVTKDVIRNLKDALLQAAADRLLAKFSTSPYDKNDLEYMLNVVKKIEEDIRERNSHSAWIIARFMALYNDGLLQSSYGQNDDYFDIDDSEPNRPYERPLLLAFLAPFFFKSPDMYAMELHSIHESFTPERWSSFVRKVDQSIRDSNLLATVLLSTNVGLLSWTDNGKTGGINEPTAEQIVTYISIICSVGSIIIGLIIFKQYRAKGADTPLRAVMVLERILKEQFGLERLAIICSLPYVLLLWGLIAFLGAFGIVFYKKTGIQVRIPVTVALFLLVLCLFFCLYTAGPPDKEAQLEAKKRSRKQKDVSFTKADEV